MDAAGLDVGNAARNGVVGGRKAALALLDQAQGIAQHFARVLIAPAGELAPDEGLEMAAESEQPLRGIRGGGGGSGLQLRSSKRQFRGRP